MVLQGANGQGKTNLLEAVYYPVLFRSFRRAADPELVRFGEAGFSIAADFLDRGIRHQARTTYRTAAKKKSTEIDGEELTRVTEGAGTWLAVTFLPADVNLASGPASLRRHYLDRTLALADRGYLRALSQYRAALHQRNAALRQKQLDLARAFDAPLAAAGARIVAARMDWVAAWADSFAAEFSALGESATAGIGYRGHESLRRVESWPQALERSAASDTIRGATSVGPHRDDLRLTLAGRPVREYGSTGQQRSAAVTLKLLEVATLHQARGVMPALLLDDVFAELDRERQMRLATRLIGGGGGQVFVTTPRQDELPVNLELPVAVVEGGKMLATR